jgi:hypothetical protein
MADSWSPRERAPPGPRDRPELPGGAAQALPEVRDEPLPGLDRRGQTPEIAIDSLAKPARAGGATVSPFGGAAVER